MRLLSGLLAPCVFFSAHLALRVMLQHLHNAMPADGTLCLEHVDFYIDSLHAGVMGVLPRVNGRLHQCRMPGQFGRTKDTQCLLTFAPDG
jgi:hypothetical protein